MCICKACSRFTCAALYIGCMCNSGNHRPNAQQSCWQADDKTQQTIFESLSLIIPRSGLRAYLLLVVVVSKAHAQVGHICLLDVVPLRPGLPVVLMNPVHLDLRRTHTSQGCASQDTRLACLADDNSVYRNCLHQWVASHPICQTAGPLQQPSTSEVRIRAMQGSSMCHLVGEATVPASRDMLMSVC